MKIYNPLYAFYILSYIFFEGCMVPALAQTESKPLMNAADLSQLKDTILSLPKLGTTGIILFIVAVLVAFAVWWWWKGYAKKITHKENEKRRRRDQAENKTENQDMTDEWDKTHETIEDIRKKDDDLVKKPRPKPPQS